MMLMTSAFALLCLSLPVRAGQESDVNAGQTDRDLARPQGLPHLGDLKRGDQIIGREVKDKNDQKIGKVEDLALDLQNGRVAEVIVEMGGTMGMGAKWVAVPPSSFICDNTMKDLRYKGDKQLLRDAPEFKASHWNEATVYAQIKETYQRFGVDPYFTHDREPLTSKDLNNPSQHAVENYYVFNGDNALPRLGYISRATRLMGTTALNLLDERLGKVDNLVIDLPAGRVVEVIVASGGFLGMHASLRAVPPEAFHWNADYTSLTLDSTSEEFKAAPHFRANEWGYATEPANITTVYDTYHVPPYFLPAAVDNGAQNVRERAADVVTPLEQSNKADQAITDQIRKAIQADERIKSSDGKNVKIMTVDGKVTLIGPVDTEDEKKLIAEAAAKVVSAEKVDNQLEVHTTPIYATPPAPVPNSTDQTK